MSDRWIVGDFTTGRLVTEVVSPGPGSSWETSLTDGRGELELIPSSRLHRIIGELLRAKLGYRYYIAAINDANIIEFAGPVTSCQLDSDSWRFSAVSAWEYLDKRTVVDRNTWASWQGDTPPIFRWSGTWRQIIAGLWNTVLNFGYSGKTRQAWLESVELQRAWRDFFGVDRKTDGIQELGDPPIIPVGDQSEGGGRHEWSVELLDMDTLGEVLQQINRRESGVEIQLQPAWLGDSPNGAICWQVVTGTDPSPHVIPSSTPWPFDVGARASRLQVSEWRANGEKILTTARVLAGRTGMEQNIQPFIGFFNNGQHQVPTPDGFRDGSPEINAADTQHTSITRMATAEDRAKAMWLDGMQPATSCEVTVQPGGVLNPDPIRVGDLASLYGGVSHAFLPDEVQRMRVLRKSRQGEETRMSLVGLRYPDLQRYKARWGNQGD